MAVLPKIPVPDLAIRFVAATRSNDVRVAAALVRSVAGTRDQSSFVRHVNARVAEDHDLRSQVTKHQKALKLIPQNGVADFGAAFPLLWGALSGKILAEDAYGKAMDVFLGRMSAEAEACLANLRQIDGVDESDVELFLINEDVHCVLGGHTVVLEAAHELCRLNVLGWYRGFQPTGYDAKFLSSGEKKLRNLALFNEYREAAHYARREELDVHFSESLDVDWECLKMSVETHVREKVLERFPTAGDEAFAGLFDRYQSQVSVEVDFSIGAAKGKRLRRIVEVKTGSKNRCDAHEWAYTLLQVFRHAAVVRTGRGKEEELEGVMYAFYSPSESLNDLLLKDIEDILILTGTPYSLCHVREGQRIPKGKGNLPESLGRKKTVPKAQTPPLGQSAVAEEERKLPETYAPPASIDRAEREKRSWDYYAAMTPEAARPDPEVRAKPKRVPAQGLTDHKKNDISPVSKILVLPAAVEIFQKYPELEVVTQTHLQKYLSGLSVIPEAFLSSEGRNLFVLMAFLKEYREGLGAKATALAEETSLAIDAFTPSQDSAAQIIKDTFDSYRGLRERTLPAIVASLVFDFPELRDLCSKDVPESEKGRVLHGYLSRKNLSLEMVDALGALSKKAEKEKDPDTAYARSLALHYMNERNALSRLPEESVAPPSDIPEEWELFASLIPAQATSVFTSEYHGDNLKFKNALVFMGVCAWSLTNGDGPKNSLQGRFLAEMDRILYGFDHLRDRGGSELHAIARTMRHFVRLYDQYRERIADRLCQTVTEDQSENIVAAFGEIRAITLEHDSVDTEIPTLQEHWEYFETTGKVLKLLMQSSARNDLLDLISQLKFPERNSGPEEREAFLKTLSLKVLLLYLKNRLKRGADTFRRKKADSEFAPLPDNVEKFPELSAGKSWEVLKYGRRPSHIVSSLPVMNAFTLMDRFLCDRAPEVEAVKEILLSSSEGVKVWNRVLQSMNRYSYLLLLSGEISFKRWMLSLLREEILRIYGENRDVVIDFRSLVANLHEIAFIVGPLITQHKGKIATTIGSAFTRLNLAEQDLMIRIFGTIVLTHNRKLNDALTQSVAAVPSSEKTFAAAKFYWDHREHILKLLNEAL